MVQIKKLSAVFILAAAAIAPVIALPLPTNDRDKTPTQESSHASQSASQPPPQEVRISGHTGKNWKLVREKIMAKDKTHPHADSHASQSASQPPPQEVRISGYKNWELARQKIEAKGAKLESFRIGESLLLPPPAKVREIVRKHLNPKPEAGLKPEAEDQPDQVVTDIKLPKVPDIPQIKTQFYHNCGSSCTHPNLGKGL